MKNITGGKQRLAKKAGVVSTIGIDLGDDYSQYCALDGEGTSIEEGRIRTTREVLTAHFEGMPSVRIAIEAGSHSAWVSRLLESFGHEVLVANTRELRAIGHSDRKSDQADAEKLARYARVDPLILQPIQHRSESKHIDLILIRVRERFVGARTMLINSARGLVKSLGYRLPRCAAQYFAERCRTELPDQIKPTLTPLLDEIACLSRQIVRFDAEIEKLALTQYPETEPLCTIPGVGRLTAVAFVLTLGEADRFRKSRDVGCYVGLCPKRSQSGSRDPELSITKAGNCYLRKTLVQCAQYILRRRSPDSALKRWGLKLANRGGKSAKKRAVIAVARKLAVLLHRLWVTQVPYDPFHGSRAELEPTG